MAIPYRLSGNDVVVRVTCIPEGARIVFRASALFFMPLQSAAGRYFQKLVFYGGETRDGCGDVYKVLADEPFYGQLRVYLHEDECAMVTGESK